MDDMVRVYTPSAGESWDWVAMALYGHERYTHHLLIANPEFVDRAIFDGTELLVIPDVEVAEETDAPAAPLAAPWR